MPSQWELGLQHTSFKPQHYSEYFLSLFHLSSASPPPFYPLLLLFLLLLISLLPLPPSLPSLSYSSFSQAYWLHCNQPFSRGLILFINILIWSRMLTWRRLTFCRVACWRAAGGRAACRSDCSVCLLTVTLSMVSLIPEPESISKPISGCLHLFSFLCPLLVLSVDQKQSESSDGSQDSHSRTCQIPAASLPGSAPSLAWGLRLDHGGCGLLCAPSCFPSVRFLTGLPRVQGRQIRQLRHSGTLSAWLFNICLCCGLD